MRYSWIAGVVGLILTFLLVGSLLHQQRQAAINAAVYEMNELFTDVTFEWARTLASLEQTLTGFQHSLELTLQAPNPDFSTLRRTMDTLVLNNHYIVSLVATDVTGQVQHWTNSGPKPNLNDRDYFTIHTSDILEEMFVGAPLPSIMSPDQWVFGASKAVRHSNGTLDKVLIAIIDTARLFRLVENLLPNQHYNLTILSDNGDIYTHIPNHYSMVGKQHPDLLVIPESGDKQDHRSAIITIDGQKYLLLIHNLDCCRFYFRGQLPLTAVWSPWKTDALMIVAAGGAVALILLWQVFSTLQLQQREKQLRAEAGSAYYHDPLTKLPLLTGADNREPEYVDHSPNTTLILISPDHFTDFIASYGEPAGETLTAHYADILKKIAPDNSRLYRATGSTFCLLLPEMDQQQALNEAGKLLKEIREKLFDYNESATSLTSSAAVTLWDGQSLELSSLLQRGASALSAARKRGGDQTCWLATREVWLERKQT